MKASEWIDRVKLARGWDSDYKVAKELGLTRQVVSRYRNNPSTMDDEAAVKVADALGAAPEVVLLDQAIERTKSTEAKAALAGLLKRLGGAAASILLAAGLGGFSNGGANLANAAQAQNLYIVEPQCKEHPCRDDYHQTHFSNHHKAFPWHHRLLPGSRSSPALAPASVAVSRSAS